MSGRRRIAAPCVLGAARGAPDTCDVRPHARRLAQLEVFTQRMFPCLAPFAYFLSCCCFTFCCKSNVKGSEKARSVMERYRHFRNIPIERAPKLKIEDTATRLERAGANKAGADVQKANEVERRLVYNERDPGAMKLVSCIRDTAGCWIECWMGDEVEVHKEKLGSAYEKRKPNRFVAGFRPGKAQNSAATFLIGASRRAEADSQEEGCSGA